MKTLAKNALVLVLTALTASAGATATPEVVLRSDSGLTLGRTYRFDGRVRLEQRSQPGSMPGSSIPVVYLTNLEEKPQENLGSASGGIEKVALLSWAVRLDLAKWAKSVKPTDRISVTGRYTRIDYSPEHQAEATAAQMPSTGLEITSLSLNGKNVLAMTQESESRLTKLAESRVLESISNRSPSTNGLEPQISAVQIVNEDRVLVDVGFVSSHGYVWMPDLDERFAYTPSSDTVVSLGKPTGRSPEFASR